ncbi:hypothetical protein KO500_08965 [Cellulophaga baltica]|uniref:hypothetical protein n=1 Tax=Cellulophaga TaxID=104264 RepID=UPI001C0789D6|nr:MULTISPECIES: hypothetical protein [Cellulophaga]MBU2996565.1 hypothetical protein [Cellulophaga baltica]MDO6767959.1 hypothetical protein [Cellulophaga sp. 1_MG-2023]
MKTILTITFVLFIGLFANAQENAASVKEAAKKENIVLVKEVMTSNETEVARLYMNKNYKVLKELSFSTKIKKTKLA